MCRLRHLRGWLSAVLALALVASSLGMAMARAASATATLATTSAGAAAASPTTVVDTVLGPVLICHQPSGTQAPATPADGCDHCVMCLALAGAVLTGLVTSGTLAMPAVASTVRFLAEPRSQRARSWPPGGVGSRAPPLGIV